MQIFNKGRFLAGFTVIIVLMVILGGCAQNHLGSFVPKWDVALQLPLTGDIHEDVTSILQEAGISDFDTNTDVVDYGINETITSVSIGEILAAIELADIQESIELGPLTISSPISVNTDIFTIPGHPEGYFGELTSTANLGDFSSLTFTNKTENQLVITLNNTGVDLTELTVTLKDQLNNEIGTANFTSFNDGSTSEIELAGKTLPADVEILVCASTAPESSGDISFSITLDQAEISAAEGLNFSSDEMQNNFTVNLPEVSTSDLDNLNLEQIKFFAGTLSLDITDPSGDITFTINSIDIGGLNGNSNSINLAGQTLTTDPINPGKINVNAVVSINGNNVSYNENDQFDLSCIFDAETAIESITADGGLRQNISETIENPLEDPDIADFLKKIELNQSSMDFKLIGLPSAASINLDMLAKDAAGNELGRYTPQSGTASTNPLINLDTNEIINLLEGNPASLEVNAEIIFADEVTFTRDSNLEMSLEGQTAFDVTLTEDFNYQIEPQPVEGFSGDDLELLEETRQSKLIAILDNQLPLNASVSFYLASVPDAGYLSSQELKDTVYSTENLITTTGINQYSLNQLEISIDQINTELLSRDDLYAGVEINIPAGDMVLKTTDYIGIEEVYLVFEIEIDPSKLTELE